MKDGYAKGGQNFIYQVPIPNSDWTLIGWLLEGLPDASVATPVLFHWSRGLLALIMCLIGIGFCSAFVDQALRPSDHHFEDWAGDDANEGLQPKDLKWSTSLKLLMPCWTKC